MNNNNSKNTHSKEDKALRDKAKQALKNNVTSNYAPEDEGGLVSGPLSVEEMKKQAEEDEK